MKKITITRESWEAVNESLHGFLDEVIAGPICEVVNYDTNQYFTFTDSEVKIKQVTETGSFTVTMTRARWDEIGCSWGKTPVWNPPKV